MAVQNSPSLFLLAGYRRNHRMHNKAWIGDGELLIGVQIPIHRGHLLRFDRGQATDLMAATIPI